MMMIATMSAMRQLMPATTGAPPMSACKHQRTRAPIGCHLKHNRDPGGHHAGYVGRRPPIVAWRGDKDTFGLEAASLGLSDQACATVAPLRLDVLIWITHPVPSARPPVRSLWITRRIRLRGIPMCSPIRLPRRKVPLHLPGCQSPPPALTSSSWGGPSSLDSRDHARSTLLRDPASGRIMPPLRHAATNLWSLAHDSP
jgi:hypothetical protein